MKKKFNLFLFILITLSLFFTFSCTKKIEPSKIKVLPNVNSFILSGKFLKLGENQAFENLKIGFGNQNNLITTNEDGFFKTKFIFSNSDELIIFYKNAIGDVRSFRKFVENSKNMNIIIDLDENGSLIVSEN